MNKIAVITGYIVKLREPVSNWRSSKFKQSSYAKWAAKEVLRYVKEHDSVPPIMAIEEFIRKMDKYSCMNTKSSYMFSVAHDIAEDILDLFLK